MDDSAGPASTKRPDHRRSKIRTAFGASSGAGDVGCRLEKATAEPADGERVCRALDHAKSATRLLEDAFVTAIGENELFFPAVEQLYATLEEAETSVTTLEAWRLRWRLRPRQHPAP